MGRSESKNKVQKIIAVNARFLLKDLEGIGRFTAEILLRLTTQNPNYQFIFFFDRPYEKKYLFSDNIIPVVLSPPARHPFLWYLWFEWAIPRALKKYKADVFLTTDGHASLRTDVPTVLVMHDLAFEHFPKQIPFLPRRFLQYYAPKFAQKAQHICTVSQYSKEDLVKRYGISPSKISVTHNAASPIFKPIESEERKKAIQLQYANGQDYFLFVGAIHPRKNLSNLLAAFDTFKRKTNASSKLLIAGRKAWNSDKALNVYEKMSFQRDVVFLGRLDLLDLIEVIGSAMALTFPSVFEGFGLPILEAMHCDVPVITSNVSSMPEVGGDAVLLVNPFDVESIADALIQIYEQPKLRQELIEKGRLQRLKFSWQKSADGVWKEVLNLAEKNIEKLGFLLNFY